MERAGKRPTRGEKPQRRFFTTPINILPFIGEIAQNQNYDYLRDKEQTLMNQLALEHVVYEIAKSKISKA